MLGAGAGAAEVWQLEIREGMHPWERVVLELSADASRTLTLRREYPEPWGALASRQLLGADEAVGVEGTMEACARRLEAEYGEGRATLRLRRGEEVWEGRAEVGLALPGREPCAAAVHTLLALFFPPPQVEWPFWDGAPARLDVRSDRRARLLIDGLDTGRWVPLRGFPHEPGEVEVGFVAPDGTLLRTEVIRLDAGRTTILRLRLDGRPPGPQED